MNGKLGYGFILCRNKDGQFNCLKNKAIKNKVAKSNTLDKRGMTLKDYFRLSEARTHVFPFEIK